MTLCIRHRASLTFSFSLQGTWCTYIFFSFFFFFFLRYFDENPASTGFWLVSGFLSGGTFSRILLSTDPTLLPEGFWKNFFLFRAVDSLVMMRIRDGSVVNLAIPATGIVRMIGHSLLNFLYVEIGTQIFRISPDEQVTFVGDDPGATSGERIRWNTIATATGRGALIGTFKSSVLVATDGGLYEAVPASATSGRSCPSSFYALGGDYMMWNDCGRLIAFDVTRNSSSQVLLSPPVHANISAEGISGISPGVVFAFGSSASAGIDVYRFRLAASGTEIESVKLTLQPIVGHSFGFGQSYTRNGVPDTGVLFFLPRAILAFGSMDNDVLEVLTSGADEEAPIFAQPQPIGVSLVFQDRRMKFLTSCLVPAAVAQDPDVALQVAPNNRVPGHLEVINGSVAVSMNSPLRVTGTIVLGPQGRMVIQNCQPGLFEVEANLVVRRGESRFSLPLFFFPLFFSLLGWAA